VPGVQGIDILPRLGSDLVLASRHEPRHETITQQTGMRKAPEGRKAEAHDLLAVALHIRHHGDDTGIETGGRCGRIGIPREENGPLSNIKDAHGALTYDLNRSLAHQILHHR
jgi:hypothetical protein